MKNKIEQAVYDIALPVTEKLNLELVDTEYKKEGSQWYLRIFIDKPGGIMIDDCEKVSRALDDSIEKLPGLDRSYIFEVSSPGLDRPMKTERDFRKYMGEKVDVRFFKPVEGKKDFSGVLMGYEDGNVTVDTGNNQVISFKKEETAYIKRTIIF